MTVLDENILLSQRNQLRARKEKSALSVGDRISSRPLPFVLCLLIFLGKSRQENCATGSLPARVQRPRKISTGEQVASGTRRTFLPSGRIWKSGGTWNGLPTPSS
jgi:hypothetical protein